MPAGKGRRASEVGELRRRVAGEKIARWLSSKPFQGRRVQRKFAVTIVQAQWRGLMAARRSDRLRRRQEERDVSLSRWISTQGTPTMSAAQAVEVLIRKYTEYRLFCETKMDFFDAKAWRLDYMIKAKVCTFPLSAAQLMCCMELDSQLCVRLRQLGTPAGSSSSSGSINAAAERFIAKRSSSGASSSCGQETTMGQEEGGANSTTVTAAPSPITAVGGAKEEEKKQEEKEKREEERPLDLAETSEPPYE